MAKLFWEYKWGLNIIETCKLKKKKKKSQIELGQSNTLYPFWISPLWKKRLKSIRKLSVSRCRLPIRAVHLPQLYSVPVAVLCVSEVLTFTQEFLGLLALTLVFHTSAQGQTYRKKGGSNLENRLLPQNKYIR